MSVAKSQDIDVVFSPEVVLVGPDAYTGLLTRNFIFYYQLKTNSSNSVKTVNDVIMKGLQGTVKVEDPVHKVATLELLLIFSA